ncbi:MAG TPA: PAS domain S-box protein [Trueperaceae bacterium]
MFRQNEQYPFGGFREILDRLPQAIVIFDAEGSVTYANRSATALVARSGGSEPIGCLEGLFRRIGPLVRLDGSTPESGDHPARRLERNETFSGYLLRSAERWEDGRPVLAFSGHLVRDLASGANLRVLTIEDVSYRHERDSLFRTAFELGPVPVSLVRGVDQRVLDANDAFLELLGYRRDEVVGHTVPELAMVHENESVRAAKEELEKCEGVERLELVVRARNGRRVTLLSWLRWVEVGGEECLLGVYVDITEQKAMEKKLREATQIVLESASVFSRSVVQQLERLRSPDQADSTTGELDLLTRRERQVVTRVGAGHSNLKIAAELALTPQTVRNYVTRIYRKIGVSNRAEAVVWARERGLVQG